MKTRTFQGSTLVAIWITAALTIWFLASIAGAVDRWAEAHQHLSGWFAALGGMAAVGAAFMVASIQMRSQQAAERERDRLDRTHKLHAAVVLFSAAASDAARITHVNIHGSGWPAVIARIATSTAGDLGQLGPFDLPDPHLMRQYGAIKTAFVSIAHETQDKYAVGNAIGEQVKHRAEGLRRLAQEAVVQAESLLNLSMNADEKAEFVNGKARMRN